MSGILVWVGWIGLALLEGIGLASQTAPDHIVISEILVGGQTARDEFVELFNPTPNPISVKGWKLTKRTKSGRESNLLSKTAFPDTIIPPYAFFLIAHPDYQGQVLPDVFYSAPSNSLAANNTVVLYDADGNIVDQVGMGEATIAEAAPAPNPENGVSLVRKAARLPSGTVGPAQDTDDNRRDFQLQPTPNPQNMKTSLAVSPPATVPTVRPMTLAILWALLKQR